MAKKSLSPEKLQELLLKVRKGATASFTLSQIQAVVEHLGGSLTSRLALMRLPTNYVSIDLSEITTVDALARLNKHKASSAPSHPPKAGILYLVTLTRFETTASKDYMAMKGIEGYLSVPAVEVQLGGRTGVIGGETTDNYRVLDRVVEGRFQEIKVVPPRPYEVVSWLDREGGWKELVNQSLGMEEHVPGASRTRENTGHCPVCLQNIKLSPQGRMVLHGYKRPGEGAGAVGKCFGVGYLPYELSDEGSKAYLDQVILPSLTKSKEKLKELENPNLPSFVSSGPRKVRMISRGDPLWERLLEDEISRKKNEIFLINVELKRVEGLVAKWRVRPLPVEGGPPFRFASAVRVAHRWLTAGASQRSSR
jgi:hypothetical protein